MEQASTYLLLGGWLGLGLPTGLDVGPAAAGAAGAADWVVGALGFGVSIPYFPVRLKSGNEINKSDA